MARLRIRDSALTTPVTASKPSSDARPGRAWHLALVLWKEGKLVEPSPQHLLHASAPLREKLSVCYDEHGDSYAELSTASSLALLDVRMEEDEFSYRGSVPI